MEAESWMPDPVRRHIERWSSRQLVDRTCIGTVRKQRSERRVNFQVWPPHATRRDETRRDATPSADRPVNEPGSALTSVSLRTVRLFRGLTLAEAEAFASRKICGAYSAF